MYVFVKADTGTARIAKSRNFCPIGLLIEPIRALRRPRRTMSRVRSWRSVLDSCRACRQWQDRDHQGQMSPEVDTHRFEANSRKRRAAPGAAATIGRREYFGRNSSRKHEASRRRLARLN
jgi:hypothetical protein